EAPRRATAATTQGAGASSVGPGPPGELLARYGSLLERLRAGAVADGAVSRLVDEAAQGVATSGLRHAAVAARAAFRTVRLPGPDRADRAAPDAWPCDPRRRGGAGQDHRGGAGPGRAADAGTG